MSTTRPAQSVVAGEGVHPTEPDDWIQRVGANGDRPAFMALFDHFAPRMKAYLLQSGMIEGDADDVAQETLLAVWRTAGQFDPETDDAATWIFKLARNLRSCEKPSNR